jgi:hypothetical protein
MGERAKLAAKTHELDKGGYVSQAKKTDFSPSINSPVGQILFLQRTVGNQAVQGLLKSGFIQAKLTIGHPGDVYEQEADQVAEQVMRMPDLSKAQRKGVSKYDEFPSIQRMCADCEKEEIQRQTYNSELGKPSKARSKIDSKYTEVPSIQRVCTECEEELSNSVGAASSRNNSRQDGAPTSELGPLVLSESSEARREGVSEYAETPSIQRTCTECEEELQRKTQDSELGHSVESQINNIRGGGQPLPESVRDFFEPRFGHDFSGVRVHTDSQANEAAKAVNALAYTVGSDIVFGSGQYSPETDSGKRLIAHELAHVVQQSGGSIGRNEHSEILQRTIGDGHDLQSERFAGDPVLEACFDNEFLLGVGARGPAVEKVQQLLVDSGFPLPNFGVDGIFGPETKEAVMGFQMAAGLSVDGIVGPKTIGRMDTLPTCRGRSEPEVVTAFAPGQEKEQQPILCQIPGGGKGGGRKLPQWSPDFIAVSLARPGFMKDGRLCTGVTDISGTTLYSNECESPSKTCFAGIMFRVMFHFDADVIPRPQPFTTAQVHAHFDYVTSDGQKTFSVDRADPDAKYVGPGLPLSTSFNQNFDIDTQRRTGILTVELFMKDKTTGISLTYADRITVTPINCV